MPDCNGIEGTKLIKSFNKNIKVVILTLFNSDDNLSHAIKNGADGYITKDIGPKELQQTIRSIYMGLGIIQNNLMDTVARRKNSIDPFQDRRLYKKSSISIKKVELIKIIVMEKVIKELSKIY